MRAPAARRAEQVDDRFPARACREIAQCLNDLGIRARDEVVEGRAGVGSKVENELLHHEGKGAARPTRNAATHFG